MYLTNCNLTTCISWVSNELKGKTFQLDILVLQMFWNSVTVVFCRERPNLREHLYVYYALKLNLNYHLTEFWWRLNKRINVL